MTTVDPSTFNALTTGDEVVSRWPDRVAGRIFLVTGASPTSIGFTTATSLAKAHPAALILIGRSASKIATTAEAVRAIDPSIYVLEVVADLASIASVRAGAEIILNDAKVPHIDVAINNAAIMAGPEEKSADGIELQFATAHVGHFVLTALIAPKLRASSEGGRVVNVSSSGHRNLNFTNVDDYDPLFEKHPYEQWHAYGNAKLANLLFTKGLLQRGFQAYSLHPGSIITGLAARIHNDAEGSMAAFAHVPDMEPMMPIKTLEQGPNTQLVAALRPAEELPAGAYLFQCQVGLPSKIAQDEGGVLTKKLWEVSERLVGLKFE